MARKTPVRSIPWNWLRPGPECDAARARDRERRQKAQRHESAKARAARRAEEDIEICRLWSEGWNGVKLARRFKLSRATISRVVADVPRPRRYGDPWEVSWPLPRRQSPAPDRPAQRPPIVAAGSLPPRELAPKGSAHGRAKLDEPKVARMRQLRGEGWSVAKLAREFGVGAGTVRATLKGETWQDAPGPVAGMGDRRKLDAAKVVEMRRLRASGWTLDRIGREFGVGRNTARDAIDGTTWADVPGAIATIGGTA